jgi:hypothetical protein
LAAFAALLQTSVVLANDSTASLDAGGLTLTFNPDIRLFCMDQDFISAAQAALKQASQDILAGTELKYVLTTAGNWVGPIQKFRLTVEKPSDKALISLCAKGINRAGPTTFTLAEDD